MDHVEAPQQQRDAAHEIEEDHAAQLIPPAPDRIRRQANMRGSAEPYGSIMSMLAILGISARLLCGEVVAREPSSPIHCCLTAAYSTDVIGEVSFFGRPSVTRVPLIK